MKKAVSVFLALLVLLSFPVLIYADGDESGGGETPAANISPSFSVIYDLPNGSSLQNESPTFAVAVLENYTNPDNKLITVGIPTINSTGFTVPIVLPAYSTVGEYRYSITQNSGNILGVTYDEDPILFCVLVGYDASDNMGVLATSVDSDGASSGKKVRFENELSSELLTGTLTVKNNVTGNVGDRTEALPITVTLETPANKTVQNTISYSVPNSNTLSFIEAGDWADSTDGSGKKVVSVTINLKHLDSVSFSDIPAGVGFSVTQSGNTGYTQSADPSSGSIASDETTVEVTNELNTTLSHGIVFQSTGYVLVIVIAAAGLFFLLFGKRRRDN